MSKKVVLAFSGGLDTSFCVPYLKEKGYEVHTVMVNTGGFSAEEEKAIEERALTLGAASHKNVNAVDTYYEKGIKYLIKVSYMLWFIYIYYIVSFVANIY